MASEHCGGGNAVDEVDDLMQQLHDICVGYYPILVEEQIEKVLRSDGYDLDHYLNQRFPSLEVILEVAAKHGSFDQLVERVAEVTSPAGLREVLGLPRSDSSDDPVMELAADASTLQRCFEGRELEALYLLGAAFALPGDYDRGFCLCAVRLLDVLSSLNETEAMEQLVELWWPGLSCGYASRSFYDEMLEYYGLCPQSDDDLETVILRTLPVAALISSLCVSSGDATRAMALLEAVMGKESAGHGWLSAEGMRDSIVGAARRAMGRFEKSADASEQVLYIEARASVWRVFKSIGCALCVDSDPARLLGFLQDWFCLEESDLESGASLRKALERSPDACLLEFKDYRAWVLRFFALAGAYVDNRSIIAAAIGACVSYDGLSLADPAARVKEVLKKYNEELAGFIREAPDHSVAVVIMQLESVHIRDKLSRAVMQRWSDMPAVAA